MKPTPLIPHTILIHRRIVYPSLRQYPVHELAPLLTLHLLLSATANVPRRGIRFPKPMFPQLKHQPRILGGMGLGECVFPMVGGDLSVSCPIWPKTGLKGSSLFNLPRQICDVIRLGVFDWIRETYFLLIIRNYHHFGGVANDSVFPVPSKTL